MLDRRNIYDMIAICLFVCGSGIDRWGSSEEEKEEEEEAEEEDVNKIEEDEMGYPFPPHFICCFSVGPPFCHKVFHCQFGPVQCYGRLACRFC